MAEPLPTPYDETAYPTAIFNQTQPDRLATLAQLAGLSPAPVETARTLEIGAGDGMNLAALAVAYPHASFTGFDLAATAVARGRRWIDLAGLTNIRLEVMDILDAGEALDGPYDYIIAHGVYAWVPPHVREATMALIGKLLAPDGVAFVSYNAMPGGYLRMALRDAMLHWLGDREGADRWSAARNYLERLAIEEERDNPAQTALRDAAKHTLNKPWSVLTHDELGPCFYPQSLTDVAEAARANGLQYFGDADRERMGDAFLPEGVMPEADTTAQLLHLVQARDHADFRFFRQTTLVRDTARPSRTIDQAALGELWACTRCTQEGDIRFQLGPNVFDMEEPVLAAALARLVAAKPERIRVRELVDGDTLRTALFQLFDAGLIDLHTVPPPYQIGRSERPATSPLVRAMLAEKMQTICTLDHRLMNVSDEGPRLVLAHLDGTRDLAGLADIGRQAGLETADALAAGLDKLAKEGVFIA
jgi:protein-L-isoaspartate O-methyltransferase